MRILETLIRSHRECTLKSDLPADELKVRLVEAVNDYGSQTGEKPFGGWLDTESSQFELTRSCHLLQLPFQPRAVGQIVPAKDGATLEFTTGLNGSTIFLLRIWFNFILGALLASGLSLVLLPNPVVAGLAFLTGCLIPGMALALVLLSLHMIVRGRVDNLVESLCRESGAVIVDAGRKRDLSAIKKSVFSDYGPVLIGIAAALALAFGLHAVAYGYWTEGDYRKSEALCRPVLALTEAALGSNSALTADCRYYVAECLRCQGRLDEAEALYNQTLSDMQRTLGGDHNFLADNHYNLGRIYHQKGDFARAEAHYRQAMALWSKAFGTGNPLAAKTLNRLAMVYLKEGKLDRAEEAERQVMSWDSRYFGKQSLPYGADLNDLGLILQAQGRLEAAEAIYRRSLSAKEKAGGRGNAATAPTWYNLSTLLAEKGQDGQSRQALSTALTTWRHELGQSATSQPAAQTGRDLYRLSLEKFRNRYEIPHYQARFDGIRPATGPD